MGTFVGRESELELLDRRAEPGAALALVGPSGVGKTVLAREWADRHGESVMFVDCFGITAAEVAGRISDRADSPAEVVSETDAWVSAARALDDVEVLVLDDVSPDFGDLADLRRNWSGILLTTSHHVPDFDGVSVLPITVFEVPALESLEGSDVHALFVAAGQDVDLRFDVSDDELPALATIADHFGGYPLALALAARRAATLTTGEVVRLIRDHVAVRDETRSERHQTIEAALAISWESLMHDSRRRLYAMSLFERPVRPSVLAAICDEELADTLDGIERLVRAGLVPQGPFPRPIEAFLDFSRRRFVEDSPTDADSIRRRIVDEAIRLADEVPRGLGTHPKFEEGPSLWLYVIEQRAAEDLPPEDRARLLSALLHWARFVPDRGLAEHETVLRLLEETPDWRCWVELARCHAKGDTQLALEPLARAEELAATELEVAQTHILRAETYLALWRPSDALAELENADTTDDEILLGALLCEAQAAVFLGDGGRARAAYRRAELLASADAPASAARAALTGSLIVRSTEEAVKLARRAVDLVAQLDIASSMGSALMNLAEILGLRAGDSAAAVEAVEEARDVFEELGDTAGRARADGLEIFIRLRARDLDGAIRVTEQATDLPDVPTPDREFIALCIAAVRWLSGATKEAADRLEPLREYWADSSHSELTGLFRACDVGVRCDLGRFDEARDLIDRHASEHPSLGPILEGVAAVAKTDAGDSIGALLQAHRSVRTALAIDTGEELAGIAAGNYIESRRPPLLAKLAELDEVDADVVALHGFSAVRLGDEWIDLTAQKLASILLEALYEADEPIGYEELGAVLYPDEIVPYTALKNRVSVQISRLRKLGLKPFIVKHEDGYVLQANVVVD